MPLVDGTMNPVAVRKGCCDDTRKPCDWHDGYESGWEAAMRQAAKEKPT